MNADLLTILEYWEREKGISRDILLNAVEEALISAAKKAVGPARDLRVQIDPKSGDIRAYATLLIVEHVESKHDHISLQEAKRRKPDAQIGEEVEVEVTPENFGRIASQNAKQALLQHLRKAEKQLIYSEFKDRTGDIVSGIVRRFERSDVYLDLGKFEALLPNRERVPTEEYQLGERVRCFVKAVDKFRTEETIYLVLNLLTHLIDSLTIIQCRQMRCTEIRCHNDERIAEINRAPVAIG